MSELGNDDNTPLEGVAALGAAIARFEVYAGETDPYSQHGVDVATVLRAARLWADLSEVFGESWLNGETVMRIQEEQK